MKDSNIYLFTCELIRRHRAAGSPADLFIADRLEEVAQLLRFTGAETAQEFAARVELNEQWAREAEFNRGWDAGRRSLRREINASPYLAN